MARTLTPRASDAVYLDRLAVESGGLRTFVRAAWPYIEGAVRFVDGWHLGAMCEHLEAVSDGQITDLVISVPPGMSKSTTTSIFWPAWEWSRQPSTRWLAASFDALLAQRDALRCKELIASDWYQDRWGLRSGHPTPCTLTADDADKRHHRQDSGGIYWNTVGGFRFSTSVGGKATGWHVNRQIIDDPIKPLDVQRGGAQALEALDKVRGWYDGTLSTRKNDPSNFRRVIIMQRLHERDLAGVCLERGYTALILPMEYDSKRQVVNVWPGATVRDPRTEDGDLLCPERFPRSAVDQGKRDLGSVQTAAQYQQDPAPEGGSIYARGWFSHFYRQVPHGARWILSLDAAFKAEKTSDFVVFQVWAEAGKKFYLVDQVRDRMDFPTTLATADRLLTQYPEIVETVIEDKANGSAVIQTLRRTRAAVIAYSPDVSKVARANASAPYWEAGDVQLPEGAQWVGDYIEEHVRFPRGVHDDQVDCSNQAILRLAGRIGGAAARSVSRLERAMRNVTR